MSDIPRNIDIWNYDAETDILFFRDNSLKYHSSINLGDVFIELDDSDAPMGVELLNASVNFNVPKIILRNIQNISASIKITETEITAKIRVFVLSRNATTEKVSIASGVNDINLPPVQAAMVC